MLYYQETSKVSHQGHLQMMLLVDPQQKPLSLLKRKANLKYQTNGRNFSSELFFHRSHKILIKISKNKFHKKVPRHIELILLNSLLHRKRISKCLKAKWKLTQIILIG